jgi:PPOX class probable F420-dependent enzyme
LINTTQSSREREKKLLQFAGEKYINLETYRKNGQGVRTPVWFIEDDDGILYVRTSDDSGKYKRIRNNPSVQLAPCDIRGGIKGNWVKGEARITSEEEKLKALKMLEKKYGMMYKMTRMFTSSKNYVVIAIRVT